MKQQAVGGALLALGGAALLYRAASGRRRRQGGTAPSPRAVEIQRSLTVLAPRDEVYRRWRDPENQRLVWSHFAEIEEAADGRVRWRVGRPYGRTLEWETRIVEERDGELLRWESTGGDLPNEGVAEFRDAPGELGTEITLRVRFDPPGVPLAATVARLFDDLPKLVLAKALRRFKSLVETGEIPSLDQNPSARAS